MESSYYEEDQRQQKTVKQKSDQSEKGFFHALTQMFYGEDRKETFVKTVKKGDILISRSGFFRGMVGHAAIMATHEWVVEMPGGGGSSGTLSSSSPSSNGTLEDNNRRINTYKWFDEHASDSITVYRCPDHSVACMAADWAYSHYYNDSFGERKTIHINYSLASPILRVINPSYCSKLVIQAYYYGTGSNNVITLEVMVKGAAIVPNQIPSFFRPKYALQIVKQF